MWSNCAVYHCHCENGPSRHGGELGTLFWVDFCELMLILKVPPYIFAPEKMPDSVDPVFVDVWMDFTIEFLGGRGGLTEEGPTSS